VILSRSREENSLKVDLFPISGALKRAFRGGDDSSGAGYCLLRGGLGKQILFVPLNEEGRSDDSDIEEDFPTSDLSHNKEKKKTLTAIWMHAGAAFPHNGLSSAT